MQEKQASHFGFINFLKFIAAQLIVLHHLAFYGPMADHVRPVAPQLIDWLDSQARIAVQVFLVIGGFLAAKSLCRDGNPGISNPCGAILRRYAKLAPPFLVATALAVGASAWAGAWMTHYSISAFPDWFDLAAHALLLHGVLGVESVAAGAWYVAIDFQLYAAIIFMLWLAGHLARNRPLPWLMPVLVAIAISASLLHFNRHAEWDDWALYFFGSYGLGIMAWWAGDPARRPAAVWLLLAASVLIALAALAIDFRSRIALALVTAGSLIWLGRARLFHAGLGALLVHRLGQISYSQFLVHFPVSLVVNAVFIRFMPAQPLPQAAGMLLAWAGSLAAGFAFHYWVERPLDRVVMRYLDFLSQPRSRDIDAAGRADAGMAI